MREHQKKCALKFSVFCEYDALFQTTSTRRSKNFIDFIATNVFFNKKIIMILNNLIKKKKNIKRPIIMDFHKHGLLSKTFFHKHFYNRFVEIKKQKKEYWSVLNINVLLFKESFVKQI